MLHLAALACTCALPASALAQPVTLKVDTAAPGKAISPDLVGIFFEDLSYAADGGLYAELVQNRDFEYSSADRPEWHALTAWQVVHGDGGRGMLTVEFTKPLHANTPHYAVLTIESPTGQVGLRNEGFDGIAVKAGEHYNFSLFARRISGASTPIAVRIESKTGDLLGEAVLPAPDGSWKKSTARISIQTTADDARLVVTGSGVGRLALDHISLFPEKTFRDRPNGLRADLAQVIADLQPKFMRFPGGCLVHGDGLDNIYHWKDTIGPVEQRKGQPNIWRYRQSVGLGYFEYFQFCADIGAKPIPVVAAGVSCQNTDARYSNRWGQGQECMPMNQMPAYIQDILDLIEFANGPATSTWGAKRAAAGHPGPFGLQYLGVGNEDHITPGFRERFEMIYHAVKEKHPEITVIGTVGPSPEGEDYEKGWQIANELRLPMVDEHGYKSPQWFWDNLQRYDGYDRTKSQVYLGEWAAHDDRRRTTLRAAIAEAAYLTALERNADIVRFASYAPLLAKRNHTHWDPNLIYFSNTAIFPTIGYHVQRLFSVNSGDTWLPTSVSTPATTFAASGVKDSASGTLILKLVNGANEPQPVRIELAGATYLPATAETTVLAGPDPMAVNDYGSPHTVVPRVSRLPIATAFDYEAPANSLTVIRIAP